MVIRILIAMLLICLGAALFSVAMKASGLSFAPDPDIGPSEFISIILTALGVIIAVVTLLIGVMAIYGWITFETRVTQASQEFLKKRFSPEDPQYAELIAEIKGDVRLQLMLSQKREDQLENMTQTDNPDAE